MTMRAMSRSSRLARPSILLAAILLAVVGLSIGPAAHPDPARAATASYMENKLLTWVNMARANHGVPPLKAGDKLMAIAGSRAAAMASTGQMVHASCLSCLLNAKDVSWSRCGEVIAYTTYPWGWAAAKSIYEGWKGSPEHWNILMSRSYTRVGFGVAYRSSQHMTFAAGIVVG